MFFGMRIGVNPVQNSRFFNTNYLISIGTLTVTHNHWESALVIGFNGNANGSYVYLTKDGNSITKVYNVTATGSVTDAHQGAEVVPISDGTGQYFLDFQVPISELKQFIDTNGNNFQGTTPIKLCYATSQAENLAVINKDMMDSSGGIITPAAPTINPRTAIFDKNSANTNYEDKRVTMTLYEATLSSVKNGNTTLNATTNSDYTISGSNVTIKKEYLAAQSVGITNLTFTFSDGSTKTLAVTVIDSTPTRLISNLSITTQTGAHRISILPNVPIQAIIGLDLSRKATYLTMDFSRSNVKVEPSNLYCYCDNANGHTRINFSIDSTDPKKLLPSDSNTLFPSGTYTFNALITEANANLILESTATAQDAAYLPFIDSMDAESSSSLDITIGTAPPLH
jgi:hypothetical protein